MKLLRSENGENRGPGRPRDEEVRKRLLKAASDLLEEVGFASVTVDLIAERAGASKATVYRWWPNKASILIEAFRDAVSPNFPFSDTGSLARDINNQLCRFAEFLQTGRGRLLAAFVTGAQRDREVAAALRDYWIAPLRKRGTAVLDGYRRRGELPADIDLDLVQDMMYAPLYYNLLTGYSPISSEYADMLTETLLSGLHRVAGAGSAATSRGATVAGIENPALRPDGKDAASRISKLQDRVGSRTRKRGDRERPARKPEPRA
jgi:AcrR family transcriptional regulator